MREMNTATIWSLLSPASARTRSPNLQHGKSIEGPSCDAEKNTRATSQKEIELETMLANTILPY